MNKQALYEELLKKKGIHAPIGVALVSRNDSGPYPLSFAQRRVWFLQQFDRTSAAYNDPTALRIRGPLDVSLLERVLNEILRRHKVLGMTFQSQNGQPVQRPHPNPRIEITIFPFEHKHEKPGMDMETCIHEFVNRFSGQPFDLSTDIPVKAALLKISEDDVALAVNIHHIVLDGWSKGLMLNELIALYEAFHDGRPSPLEEPRIQYTDYVFWHQEWIKVKIVDTQLAYWKGVLTGAPPVLELPTDYPRPVVPAGKGSWEPFFLSLSTYQALEALARQENATLFMLLTAAFNTLLYRYSGQEDILTGTPTAGRPRVELENLIGLFVNTLVIRVDFSGDPEFQTLLGRVRTAALGAYANQDLPFEKLVEELNPRRNLSINPIFQVMFLLQTAPMPPARISGLTITPIQVDTGFSQMDLSVTMWPENGTLRGTFEYNTDLFRAETIQRMVGHFHVLLDGIISDIQTRVSCLPMLTEEEMHRLIVEWNNTGVETVNEQDIHCINRRFDSCVNKNREETAVIIGDEQITYGVLDRESDRLACYLRTRGIGRERMVGICMGNALELIVGVMAVLKTGAAYIPMDPQYPDRRLNAIVNDACPDVVLTQPEHSGWFVNHRETIVSVTWDRDAIVIPGYEACDSVVSETYGPGQGICVIYTSGSTGEPKGILMESRGVMNLIDSFIRSYHPGVGDRILPLTSIASASFVGEILPLLTSGGGIILVDKTNILDIKKLVAILTRYQITILSAVPSMIARLNAMPDSEWNPGRLRLLLSGGEALSPGDIDRLIRTVTVVNGYGLTEATICSTYTILNPGENIPDLSTNPVISVGKPIINTQVYIVDKNGHPVPVGVPGEIYIGGHGISRGYLNNPELTNQKFLRGSGAVFSKRAPENIFKTGDIGCYLFDGNIKFLGRMDTQVQVHGYRIELSEIETHLGLHPAIRDVVVIDRDIVPGDKRLVAYIVFDGESIQSNQLREWLGKRVPEYMIPAVFEAVESIPLTLNGKVDKDALPVPLSWSRPALEVDYKAPQTQIEQTIAGVWQEFLRLDKIGIHDNFFDMGGHSLLVTQVHSRLSEIYKDRKELTIVDMFRFPTIVALAEYIGGNSETKAPDVYRKIRERAEKQQKAYGANKKFFNRRSTS
ncbi:MAG: non-ribosomal peptide synthetase [Candidatus Omnitrophota bacterium]